MIVEQKQNMEIYHPALMYNVFVVIIKSRIYSLLIASLTITQSYTVFLRYQTNLQIQCLKNKMSVIFNAQDKSETFHKNVLFMCKPVAVFLLFSHGNLFFTSWLICVNLYDVNHTKMYD